MDGMKDGMESEEATETDQARTPGTRRWETQRPLKRLHGILDRKLAGQERLHGKPSTLLI